MLRKKAVIIDRHIYLRKTADIENCAECIYRGRIECTTVARCGNYLNFERYTHVPQMLKYHYYFDSYASEKI